MKKNSTFTAMIYVGLRHGYCGEIIPLDDVRLWLQDHCTKAKLGITLTQTEFIYVNGEEPGVIIGLINYPRFPSSEEQIKERALAIAKGLMEFAHQERVSIVLPDETIMLEKQEEQMSDEKVKTWLDYDWETFRKQMAEATDALKKMNEAATYMRWQWEMDEAMKEFQKEIETASGWLASWCG